MRILKIHNKTPARIPITASSLNETAYGISQIKADVPSTNKMLKILELFGGIGACSKALERIGIDYEIADYVEIDKYAVKSFNAMHDTNFEPQDICKWDKKGLLSQKGIERIE